MKTSKPKMPMMDKEEMGEPAMPMAKPAKTPAGFTKKAKPNAFKAPTKTVKGNPFAKKK